MEQIIKNIFNDPELASQVLETANELKKKNLILKGGTSCWVGDKYIYTFIFEDTSDIASIDLPIHNMHREEQLKFRTRQNRRADLLYRFLYEIMDETLQDITLSDITNNIITITCTIS